MIRQQGQAVVEGLMLITLFALVALTVKEVIHPFNVREHQRIDSARAEIWRYAPSVALLQQSADYSHAHRAKVITHSLTVLTNFDLPLDNLRVLDGSDEHRRMLRLTDSWTPKSTAELAGRPAQLTPFSHLSKLGVPTVQRLLGSLHFTEEIAPDQLVFGYVNSDATPAELPCYGSSQC